MGKGVRTLKNFVDVIYESSICSTIFLYPISTVVVPENPCDVAHDLGVVAEPLRHVGQHGVALQGGEGLTAALAVQGVPVTLIHTVRFWYCDFLLCCVKELLPDRKADSLGCVASKREDKFAKHHIKVYMYGQKLPCNVARLSFLVK